jgi:hypothetical protein
MVSLQQVETVLRGARPGDELFVSYLAGRPPSARAIREVRKARDQGYATRWLEGRVERVAVNSRGETYATVFTYTRYDEKRPGATTGASTPPWASSSRWRCRTGVRCR